MSRRHARLLLVGAPLLVVAIVAYFGYAVLARASRQAADYQSAQPDLGVAPTYTLTDQNGHPVTSRQLAGKIQVVTYLFPYCTTFCPTITRTLKELQADLTQEGIFGSKVDIVAFNVDPTGSGPKQMRTFLSQYGVDPASPGWHYLTGTLPQIDHVVKDGYHVYFSKISLAAEDKEIAKEKAEGIYTSVPTAANPLADRAHVSYDIVHNDYVEVVGPNGHIQQMFNGDQVSETQLFKAVRTLAAGTS